VEELCPLADDPANCEVLLSTYWPVMGQAVYPVFLEANGICAALGACTANKKKVVVKELTCEDCTSGIAGIADIVGMQIPEITEFLKVS
jgi:hypothetical protein